MQNSGENFYDQFLDSLESIEQKVGKTNSSEIRTKLIEIQLDIFSNIDTMSYHEAITILEKIKAISSLLSIKA